MSLLKVISLAAALCSFTAFASAEENKASSGSTSVEASKQLEPYDDFSSSVLQAQVILDRTMFSSGAIDGLMGTNARHTLKAFQHASGLEPTGKLDKPTSAALTQLAGDTDYVLPYQVTDADWDYDFLTSVPDEMNDQAALPHLHYTTITELLAERFHATPRLLATLNPDSTYSTGSTILVPNVYPTWIRTDIQQLEQYVARTYKTVPPGTSHDTSSSRKSSDDNDKEPDDSSQSADSESKKSESSSDSSQDNDSASDDSEKPNSDTDKPSAESGKPAKETEHELSGQKTDDGRITSSGLQLETEGDLIVVVTKADTSLNVFDATGRRVFHAPVTAGSEHDPLPLGEWKINGTERFPKFNYNPKLFWDAEESDKKAKIPAGPNNPVGAAWIDISKPHYGLHGTPEPSKIGYTESHGCVRLTNWDVLRLADLVKPETKVLFLENPEEIQQALQQVLSADGAEKPEDDSGN